MPIANYDDLSVEEVENELEGLSEDEMEKVSSYEKEHKGRNTLLKRLERKIGEESCPPGVRVTTTAYRTRASHPPCEMRRFRVSGVPPDIACRLTVE